MAGAWMSCRKSGVGVGTVKILGMLPPCPMHSHGGYGRRCFKLIALTLLPNMVSKTPSVLYGSLFSSSAYVVNLSLPLCFLRSLLCVAKAQEGVSGQNQKLKWFPGVERDGT